MNEGSSAKGLQVPEDRHSQEFLWRAQRVGWILMLLLVFLALAGATGAGGALATARVETAAGTIEYPRIARWQAATEMTVTLPPEATGDFELQISDSFLKIFTIETVSPEPTESVATPDGHKFTFNVRGHGKKSLEFDLRASRPTLPHVVHARLQGTQSVDLPLVVLP